MTTMTTATLASHTVLSLVGDLASSTDAARQLNDRMAASWVARATYALTYGREWAPLPEGADVDSRRRRTDGPSAATLVATLAGVSPISDDEARQALDARAARS